MRDYPGSFFIEVNDESDVIAAEYFADQRCQRPESPELVAMCRVPDPPLGGAGQRPLR